MLLFNYIPQFVANTKEVKVLFQILQVEMSTLLDKIEKRLLDMFVLDSSECATERYENIVGIVPKLSESLNKRQLDILTVYNEMLPFTFEHLIIMLRIILGEDGFKLEIDIANFELTIVLARHNLQFQETINSMFERVIPLNIALNYKIDWNTWGDLKPFTWGEIVKYTWEEVKESEELNSEK